MSTTATYYIIKTAAEDVKHSMEKLENDIPNVVRDIYEHKDPPKRA